MEQLARGDWRAPAIFPRAPGPRSGRRSSPDGLIGLLLGLQPVLEGEYGGLRPQTEVVAGRASPAVSSRLPGLGRQHPLVEERMGAPVAVLARTVGQARAEERHELHRAVGRVAGGRGPTLAFHVRLVFVVAAVAAQQQLRQDDARRVAAVDEIPLRPVAGVVVAVGVGNVQHRVAVLVRRHGDPHQHRLRQDIQQHRLALETHPVLARPRG